MSAKSKDSLLTGTPPIIRQAVVHPGLTLPEETVGLIEAPSGQRLQGAGTSKYNLHEPLNREATRCRVVNTQALDMQANISHYGSVAQGAQTKKLICWDHLPKADQQGKTTRLKRSALDK